MSRDVRSEPGDLTPGDLTPGEQIAGYRIQEQIGRGGMAVVYRALDLRLHRPVALKVLAPDRGEDEAFRQRFIRESRAAAGVDHPHIIPVLEAGESGGVLFIAMRYVSGGDLRSLIEAGGGLPARRAAAITSQVASALDAAHARGLVHRDVKPANILLGEASASGHDHVYLSDFGLSKQSLTPSTLTSTGQFFGTLDYVPPEQIQGHPVDGRADQYALACAVVEMLTGTPPFVRDDTMAVMWAQLEATPPRITERRPGLPPAVDQVIDRALAKSPASRYPTCRDFAVALTAACATRPGRSAVPAGATSRDRDDRPIPGWPADSRPGGNWPADNWPGVAGIAADGIQPAPADRRNRAAAAASRAVPSGAPAGEPDLARNFLNPGTPAGNAWPSQRPQVRAHVQGGTWSPSAGAASPPGGRPRRNPRRTATVAILVAVLVLVLGVVGVVGYWLAHRNSAAALPPPARTMTVQPRAAGPAATVRAYFAAINQGRYGIAWRLSGEKEPYQKFAAGFAGTAHDAVRILSVSGDVVAARLVATQADGTVKTFAGTYTVTGGVISAAHVRRIS